MREAQSRSADIEDVKADDFVRLCEFAYRGDYSTALYKISKKESDDSQSAIDRRNPHAGYGGLRGVDRTLYIKKEEPKEKHLLESQLATRNADWPVAVQEVPPEVYYDSRNSKKSRKEPDRVVFRPAIGNVAKFKKRFDRKCFCKNELPCDPILASFETVSNSSSNQDFTSVFLAHAHIYILADRYLMPSLKYLAFHKLHRTLLNFKMYASRIGDVMELARYVYSSEHTCERSENGAINELREIVVEYVIREIEVIGGFRGLLALMEEGGSFVTDFWGLLWKDLL